MSHRNVLQSPGVNMWTSVLHYVLAFSLLYYAVDGQFSFDAKLGKTASGTYVTHGIRTDSDGQNLQRIVETGSAMLVLAVLILRSALPVLSGVRKMWAFLLITIWTFASAAWSQNPVASLRNAAYLLFNVLLATYLVKRFSPMRQVQLLVFVGVVFTLSNLAIAVVLPRYGLSRNLLGAWSLEGICPHKNECAYMSLFLVSPLLFVKHIHGLSGGRRQIYLALVTIVVLLTRSRTGWLMALFLILFSIATRILRRFESKSSLSLLVAAIIPSAIGAYAVFQTLPNILTSLGKDSSLHGRFPIWVEVVMSIRKRPLTGYGFHGFWQGLRGESARIVASIPWDPNNAHNGFLEVWVELGAVAVVLTLWCIVKAVIDYGRCRGSCDREYVDWYLTIVLVTVFLNIDETELLGTINLGWTLFMMSCLNLALQSKKASASASGIAMGCRDKTLSLSTV